MFNSKQELSIIKERMISAGVSDDEIVTLLKPLEDELERRVCGLVWEHKDTSIPNMNGKLPAFIRQDEKCITGTGGTDNILVEGENLYALMGLQYTHIDDNGNGLIDAIYIDPPYNTEASNIPYNDKYEKSEWISIMDLRLRLAHNLLKPTGAIFISIDDAYLSQLKLLMDDIFGVNNFVANIIWKRKRGRDNSAKWFSKAHEYGLIYAYDKSRFDVNKIPIGEDSETRKQYRNSDNDPRGDHRDLACWARGVQGGVMYDYTMEDGYYFSERKWLFSKENLKKMEKDNRLIRINDNLYRKKFITEHNGQVAETVWDDVSNSADASDTIKEIFGEIPFGNPKPVDYIQKFIRIAADKHAIILDFFAGSGTTGQAVMELNAKDNGTRRFILCTNSEVDEEIGNAWAEKYIGKKPKGKALEKWKKQKAELEAEHKKDEEYLELGICRRVTLPRLATVITGKRRDGSEYVYPGAKIEIPLYEQKITLKDIQSGAIKQYYDEALKIKDAENNNYDNVSITLSNDSIIVTGIRIVEKRIGLQNNLYYYSIDDSIIESETNEETINVIINKFISYVSIKESAFNISAEEDWVRLKSAIGNEIFVITNTDLTLRDIKKATKAAFSSEYRKVYCRVPECEEANGIEYVPYPKEIMDVLSARRKDIIKGELR